MQQKEIMAYQCGKLVSQTINAADGYMYMVIQLQQTGVSDVPMQ